MIERFDPLKGERLQVLDEEGRPRPDLEPALAPAELRALYERMVLARTADTKALKLQRQGRLGTYAPSRGHEAAQVGLASAMERSDWLFPYFRDLGSFLTLGYPLTDWFHFWMGHEAGMRTPEGLNIFPVSIPVGSQIPQAVGAALGLARRGLRAAVVVTFGDGATSEGDFHEGLNFAGVFRTPNVFFCQNNQYAISVPRSRQTAAATIAQKATAYGFAGVQIDGNDVLAVYAAAREALEKARTGGGPTLIEAVTYRLGDHTTSDDAGRYRPPQEVEEWERREPLIRFRAYLERKELWDRTWERAVQEGSAETVERAVAAAEARPAASVDDLFAFTYAAMPPELEAQLAELKARTEEAGR